jgi:hydroxyacylglutathione hydrolase
MIFKKLFAAPRHERAAIGVDEAKRRVDAGDALLVDVREPDEWRAGHVAGAAHIPLGEIASRAVALPKDREILLICRTGNRSAMAQERLEQAGVANVANVEGGRLTGWSTASPLPRERGQTVIIDRIYTPGLAQVAYIVADADVGVAAVIDPRRDTGVYLDWAAAHRVRIVAILETHIHADFVSGARELAAATRAPILVSRIGGQAFATDYLGDGDDLPIGALHLKVLATPGHTPEHLAYLLFDPAHGPDPVALFSGDALFVGEVGRPDLLGEDETQQLAIQLYRTVERLKALPDDLVVYPGHTAGSACGKKIGDAPTTTIGREKRGNYAFHAASEGDFVKQVLADMPPSPTYYPILKRVNKAGAVPLADLPPGAALTPADVADHLIAGSLVVDARTPEAFGAGHIPGAVFAGLGENFTTWMGWLAPYDRDVVLILGDDRYDEACTELHRIGLDRVAGFLAGGMRAWVADGRTVRALPQLSVEDLARRRTRADNLAVLDVRGDDEWETGHIGGAVHRFAGEIIQGAAPPISDGQPTAVVCGSGYRASVAASVLEGRGYGNLRNVTGGMEAWEAAGLPEEDGGRDA